VLAVWELRKEKEKMEAENKESNYRRIKMQVGKNQGKSESQTHLIGRVTLKGGTQTSLGGKREGNGLTRVRDQSLYAGACATHQESR